MYTRETNILVSYLDFMEGEEKMTKERKKTLAYFINTQYCYTPVDLSPMIDTIDNQHYLKEVSRHIDMLYNICTTGYSRIDLYNRPLVSVARVHELISASITEVMKNPPKTREEIIDYYIGIPHDQWTTGRFVLSVPCFTDDPMKCALGHLDNIVTTNLWERHKTAVFAHNMIHGTEYKTDMRIDSRLLDIDRDLIVCYNDLLVDAPDHIKSIPNPKDRVLTLIAEKSTPENTPESLTNYLNSLEDASTK